MGSAGDIRPVTHLPKPRLSAWWAVWDLDEKKALSFFRDPKIAECQAINDRALTGHRIRVAYWNYGVKRLDGR